MIVFARTRHNYESYTDFWTLVSLAGFPTCYVDEVDLRSGNIYITTMYNSEWNRMTERGGRRDAHFILWNLERPKGWASTVPGYNYRVHDLMGKRLFDEIWVSDRRLAQEAEIRFVILGSHPKLGTPGARKSYDIVHMSYMTNRRQSIYKVFDPRTIAPNGWGNDRDRVLRASRFALNVHQDDHPFQEPLRFALFAAYGIPILSETILDSHPWYDYMQYENYARIAIRMNEMIAQTYEPWRQYGLRARERMTGEFEFGKLVRQAVKESTGE